jgi:hypothetical protein
MMNVEYAHIEEQDVISDCLYGLQHNTIISVDLGLSLW